MNVNIIGAALKKDVQSLLPLLLLTVLLFLGDALIVRLDLLPVWTMYGMPVLLLTSVVLILSVFQLDSPASLNDDWLCRPVPRGALLAGKLLLLLATVYLPRAVGTFIADLSLGVPLWQSLVDALLLQDKLFLLLLPILVFTAIVTQTIVQGFGVLIAIVICVFVIPTPFVRPPDPLSPGIRDALLFSGMQWLATTPAQLASLILVALGIWLVYWRRRILPARVLMLLTVCVTMLFVLLPMALLPWKRTFAVQMALGPAPPAVAANLSLRDVRACFPATRLGNLPIDAEFNAVTHGHGLALWGEEELRGIGPGSIAFLTAVEPRGLPLDWRVKLNFVQADYSTGAAPLYSLRPARYLTDDGSNGPLAHAWMLPEVAVQRLRGADAQLQLAYSLSLLKPREFTVPTSGERHSLPGLGSCSAKIDEPGNRIEVDCLSAFGHPAQISAELNEIPASRVYGPANFAPRWAQWPYTSRVKLAIGSPRLARHDSITVTAWDEVGSLQKSLTLTGILGAGIDTCALPTADGNRFQQASWHDAASHEVHSISVDDGVQLEVLDFGGNGSPVVLLPGLGATAHSFDEFAPQLARKYRVIAITRRGTGSSSKPDFGFDTPRLSQDVLRVMDAMKIGKAVLIGHSIAGDELTWLGGHHSERFAGLVYLDAAYDRSGARNTRLRELNGSLPPEPPIPPQALLNYDAATKLLAERGHLRLPQGEMIALLRVNTPFLAGTPSIDARTQQAITAAIRAPDYAAVNIPALAIYAIADSDKPLPPWYDASDEKLLSNIAEIARIKGEMQLKDIETFRRYVAQGQVLELANAAHNIILSNPPEVLHAIEEFVRDLKR
jgi:pimeloyl-ACP methyl ester carboxylesterase